jgi:hypothetical protein
MRDFDGRKEILRRLKFTSMVAQSPLFCPRTRKANLPGQQKRMNEPLWTFKLYPMSNGHLGIVPCVLKKEQTVAPLNVAIFSAGIVLLVGVGKR